MKWLFYAYALTRNILLAMVAVALIHTFIGSVFLVSGLSMTDTLNNNDVLWVNKLAYLKGSPARGDIVVLKYPGDPEKRKFVKRIIGLPGEEITIEDGDVFINNKKLVEAYLAHDVQTQPNLTINLSNNEYYTVGDNRMNSSDSRVFGPTPRQFLIGRAKLRLLPFSQAGYIPAVFY